LDRIPHCLNNNIGDWQRIVQMPRNSQNHSVQPDSVQREGFDIIF